MILAISINLINTLKKYEGVANSVNEVEIKGLNLHGHLACTFSATFKLI